MIRSAPPRAVREVGSVEPAAGPSAGSVAGYEPGLVSIITPAFNAAKYIAQTIECVLKQTYLEWEMVIADDGSTDETAAIVERYAALDSRIRLFRLPRKERAEAGGPARARTLALQNARGRYVAFLDADDLWKPEKLERQMAFVRTNRAAFAFTAFRRMTLDGSRAGRLLSVPSRISYRELLVNNRIGCLTVVIDREQVEIPRITPGFHEDYMLWLAILRTGVLAHGQNEDLALYRVVPGSRSSKRFRAVVWRWRNYRMQEKLPVPVALGYFLRYLYFAVKKHILF